MDFSFIDKMQQQRLSQARLTSTELHNRPTLLFVHGGFHGAWCWSQYLEFFVQRAIPAAAIDLRGHGGLPAPPDFARAGVAEMAADITEAAAALKTPVILVGHSLGALAAMAAAEHVRPSGIIMIAPAPPANVDVRLMPPFPSEKLISPPPPDRANRWFLQGYHRMDIDPYLARLCPESPAFLNDCYRRTISVQPSWVQGPTLCISAALDDTPLHPAGQDQAVAEFFGAELQTIPEAGHCLMLDDTLKISAEVIAAWLKRNKLQ